MTTNELYAENMFISAYVRKWVTNITVTNKAARHSTGTQGRGVATGQGRGHGVHMFPSPLLSEVVLEIYANRASFFTRLEGIGHTWSSTLT